jgi:F420-0:gamma-glutamyl ligase
MQVTAIKTPIVTAGAFTIFEVLDDALPNLENGCIVAVTSKIVSICEGSIVPHDYIDKEQLVVQESSLYLPATESKYGHHFTVTNNTVISMAGIDESNGEGYYILWPRDAQATANNIRRYLADKHGLTSIGVLITDSTCQPLRRGTTGIALAHSGFAALRDYVGTPDLFGRPFAVIQANVAGGVAAAAVLAMGEGSEQTPLAVLSDLPSIAFQQSDPTAEDLAESTVILEEDLFAPFLTAVKWERGDK